MWTGPDVGAGLLRLLRAAGVHAHAADLLPVQAAVLAALRDRMAHSPAALEALLPGEC